MNAELAALIFRKLDNIEGLAQQIARERDIAETRVERALAIAVPHMLDSYFAADIVRALRS